MSYDCCFAQDKNWFRYRAAGIVVEDGKVLFVGSNGIDYLYTVGGGVHMGETSSDCVIREMLEEVGVEYEIDHLAAVVENFFLSNDVTTKGLNCHCIEFYYIMKSKGFMPTEAKSVNMDGERERLVWVPISELENTNIKPKALKDNILELIKKDSFMHIVNKG